MYDRNFPLSLWREARGYLKGSYDWHIHTGPSIFWRRAEDNQVLAEAAAAGMAGIGLKSHEGDTAPRARLLNNTTCCKVLGGVTLNHFVGGLNPAAVEASLAVGGKIVWLPTLASRQHIQYYKKQKGHFLAKTFKHEPPSQGISVLDPKGDLVPEMHDIISLVKSQGAVLSTGHLSPQEALTVARSFSSVKGPGYVVLGHPDMLLNQADIQTQKEFIRLGGYVEKCVLALSEHWGSVSVEAFAAGIKELGAEHCIFSTDSGGQIPERPSPPEIITRFIAAVLEKRLLSEKELRTILADVPGMLFAL